MKYFCKIVDAQLGSKYALIVTITQLRISKVKQSIKLKYLINLIRSLKIQRNYVNQGIVLRESIEDEFKLFKQAGRLLTNLEITPATPQK